MYKNYDIIIYKQIKRNNPEIIKTLIHIIKSGLVNKY